jgi:hypothetical protein
VIELLVLSLLVLSLGSLLCLPLIGVREIGRGFFTLWAVVIGVLGAIAFLLIAPGAPGGARAAVVAGPGAARIALLLGICLALLAVFWALLRFTSPAAATTALVLTALAGALVLRQTALAPPAAPPGAEAGETALRVVSLLVSALAVGAVTVAMVLGHWYLVQPKLALAPLRRLCDVFLGVLVARLAVSAWGFFASLRAGHHLLSEGDPVPWEALILSQRLLFGFGGSLILAVMIRKTVALRSTMSATGLLYIAILFVWVGEFLSIYLERLTGGALVV